MMREIVRTFTETVEKYRMIDAGDHVVAGVSGGPDSVCLLALLREYMRRVPFRVSVLHVEHGLRGKESLEDAGFVEALCQMWQLDCRVTAVDVTARVKQEKETLEEAARRLRYQAFEEYAGQVGANRIAVAHNRNDQAETVLLNLARGSGVKGLGGILPVRGKIVRPLLFISREEIEEWLKSQGLTWRTDRTNLEGAYARNRIRLQVLPLLEQQINREAVRHVAECALHLQKAEAYLERQAEILYRSCVREEPGAAVIALEKFLKAEELMQEYVLRLAVERVLKGRGLKDYAALHIEKLKELAAAPCGKRLDLPGGLWAVRRRQELVLKKVQGQEAALKKVQQQKAVLKKVQQQEAAESAQREQAVKRESQEMVQDGSRRLVKEGSRQTEKIFLSKEGIYEFLGCRFRVEFLENTEKRETFPEKKYTKWLAYDTINNDLCLRTRQTGDYLCINRQGGRKKLKDYLIDCKLPREERDDLPLVAAGSHVLWAVGLRISEDAKVRKETEKMVKIQMMEDGE